MKNVWSAGWLVSVAIAGGCAGPAVTVTGPDHGRQPPPMIESAAALLPESASPVSFADMARFPEPGWQVPRAPRFSPDGKLLTYLMSEGGTPEMALYAVDLPGGSPRVLVRASDLAPAAGPTSQAEELRNERQRKRIEGITEYAWASQAGVLLIPAAGDLFVRDAQGKISRLTDTPDAEIDPKPCADGSRVAFVRGADVFVLDVATKREARVLASPPPEGITRGTSDFNGQEEFDEPSGHFWAPDCKRLVTLEVDERAVAEVPVLGHRKGKPNLMMQRYPEAGGKNPRVKVLVADVTTHRASTIDLPKEVGEGAYVGRFRFTTDGKHLVFLALSRAQDVLTVMDVPLDAQQKSRAVATLKAEHGWIEMGDLELAQDGKRAFVLGPSGGRQKVFEVSLDATGVPSAPRAISPAEGDVITILGHDHARGLSYVGTAGDPFGRQLFALAQDGAVTRLTQAAGMHEVTLAKAGGAYFDLHSASGVPPTATVRGLATPIPIPMARDPEIDRMKLRAPTPFDVALPGGASLHGTVLAPRTIEPGKRYPLVLMVYGGPGVQTVQDRWSPRLLWQHLADRGFFVAQLDNRGSAGRGYDFATPIHRKLGEVELGDQLAGLEALLRAHPIDPARVGIYGHSYGGFVAALAMLRAPGKFAAGIAASPVTDWRSYDTGYTERFMGTPENNQAGYDGSDLEKLAPNLAGELLIVHALMDENVHFQNTADLVDALVAAKKPFDMFVFPGERHGYRSPPAREYASALVTRYLVRHLGPRAVAP